MISKSVKTITRVTRNFNNFSSGHATRIKKGKKNYEMPENSSTHERNDQVREGEEER